MIEDTIKKYLKRKIRHFDESQDEKNDDINYFRRSRIHWLFLLNLLHSHYEKKIITKSDLIHKIQVSHITILKYIKESLDKKLIVEIRSKEDKRKVCLMPSKELIKSFENFFYDETRSLKDLFEERQEY
jgi:DNA-binding MarR family transcriptional regulator